MIGKRIGKYHFIAQLGRGTTGIVYKAVDETLNRAVAIKILNPDIADPEVMKRFRAEATTLAKLNHPEIATIYELVKSENDLLMVMEFVTGQTLEAVSGRVGPLPPESAAYLIDRVLAALDHAHSVGVVHRDIKPANVMLTTVGGVKIMDFGIARVRGVERMTIDRCMMGTPAYMAPEQVLGEEVDGRADLYSVGVVFYRLLTGALPFTSDHAIGVLQQQISQSPAPLDRHRAGLPDWCHVIVERALAKAPADRFGTAEEFRAALSHSTGVALTADSVKAFSTGEAAPVATDAPASPTAVGSLAPYEATVRESVTGASTSSRRQPRPRLSAWVRSPLAVVAGGLAIVASIALYRPSTQSSSRAALPPLRFEAKTVINDDGKAQERDARLELADGLVTVSTKNVSPLYFVRFDQIRSITYSQGRDPMWNSPKGPTRIVRLDGGTLGRWGILVQRHWIALETAEATTSNRFVMLNLDEAYVRAALQALEERTGRRPYIVRRGTE